MTTAVDRSRFLRRAMVWARETVWGLWPIGGASVDTLVRRVGYGGRKGRAAERRLSRRSHGTAFYVGPSYPVGSPAYERWALFQAKCQSVTVGSCAGTQTFAGPQRGASRAQKIAWFTATRSGWQPSPEAQGEQR